MLPADSYASASMAPPSGRGGGGRGRRGGGRGGGHSGGHSGGRGAFASTSASASTPTPTKPPPSSTTATAAPPNLGFFTTITRPLRVRSTLFNAEERHQWFEDCMGGAVGKALNLFPLILGISIACTELLVALWVALGCALVILLVDVYRHSYNAAVHVVNPGAAFNATLNSVFLVLAYHAPGFSAAYIAPLTFSVLLTLAALSVVAMHPFTRLPLASSFPEATRSTVGFWKLNMILSSFFVVVLAGIAAAAWCAFVYFPDQGCQSSAGGSLLNTTVPIVGTVLAILFTTKFLLPRLKAAYTPEVLEAERIRDEGGLVAASAINGGHDDGDDDEVEAGADSERP